MRNFIGFVLLGAVAPFVLPNPASAAVVTHFSDGFETQTDPLVAPPVGQSYVNGGSGNNYDLVSAAASGTTALQVIRTASANPNLTGVGTPGGVVGGRFLEYTFKVNHRLIAGENQNGQLNPIQVSFMLPGGAVFARLSTVDVSNFARYTVTNHPTALPVVLADTGKVLPKDTAAYDSFRLVFSLTSPTANTIGGTYDVYIGTDGAALPTTPTLSNLFMTTVTVPLADVDQNPSTALVPDTRPALRIQKGGNSSATFYDDILITSTPIPEPATLSLIGVGACILLGRRRSRSIH